MSRGFVKEEDQEEAPLVPPRAAIPPGVTNYVTPTGLQALLDEKAQLEQDKTNNKKESETERRYENLMIEGKLKLLVERINTARVVEPSVNPEEVRFGTTVSVETVKGKKPGLVRKFTIVGADEADVKAQKIAFLAPIAKAVIGKRVNEEVDFHLGTQVERLKVIQID